MMDRKETHMTLEDTLQADWNVYESGYGSLVELLRDRAAKRADALAFQFLIDGEVEGQRLTYGELDRKARAIAAALQQRCNPGDRALLLYPPGLEYISAFFGCLYAGVIAVPVYPPEPARLGRSLPRLRVIAEDAEPTVVLTVNEFAQFADILPEFDGDFPAFQWVATDTLEDGAAAGWTLPEISPADTAFLQYTSGSTSHPKGVMVTHANLLYNLYDMRHSIVVQSKRHSRLQREALLTWLPAFHDMGLIWGLLYPVYAGCVSYVMSPLAFLQHPFRWLHGISKYRVTFSVGPNFAYDLCARKVTPEQRSRLDLSSWCWAGNGAEPIRPETLERFLACFGPCGFHPATFCPGYGLAEATLKVSAGSVGDHLRFLTVDAEALAQHRVVPRADRGAPGTRTLVSCGQVAFGTRVRIVDPECCTARPADQVGEIWVSGPTVAAGYWNRPIETEETFRARLADSDAGPFLRTGDLGFLHEGSLYVTGRLKDVIIVDGANHYPQDIEHTVETSHPAVRPGCSAAFAVDGETSEHVIVVAEVNGAPLGASEAKSILSAIRRAVRDRHDLRVHKICLILPRTIHKTSSGKLQRHACRNAYLGNTLELVAVG